MDRRYARLILNIVIPILTFYLICGWGPRFLLFFMPFVIGWIVAFIANPLVRFLEKKLRIVRKHSSILLIVVVLALVISGIYFLTGWCFKEGVEFAKALPALYECVRPRRGDSSLYQYRAACQLPSCRYGTVP